MIPDFDENGNLPPGTHHAALSEVLRRYGKPSPKRKSLTKRLREFMVRFGDLLVGVYIDGSYITHKLTPGDVDLLLLLPSGFDWGSARVRELDRVATQEKKNKRAGHRHELDIYAFEVGVATEKVCSLIRTWTSDRDGNRKGIIYVETSR